MPVTMKNTERRMKVINLPHESFCKAAGKCSCAKQNVTTVLHDARTGERNQKVQVKLVPTSLTLLSLEIREGLDEALLQVPEVKRALRAGRLRVIEQKTVTKDSTQTEAVQPVTDSKPEGEVTRKRKRG